MRTYSDNKYIYSVDMMFTYVNNYKMLIKKVKAIDLFNQLKYDCWGDPLKSIKFSPISVIENPKKYPDDSNKILKANLKYPIIMSFDFNIVDGMHRLAKVYLQKKKYINAYLFDKNLMKKFIIGKRDEWEKIRKIPIYELMNLFVKRFHINN